MGHSVGPGSATTETFCNPSGAEGSPSFRSEFCTSLRYTLHFRQLRKRLCSLRLTPGVLTGVQMKSGYGTLSSAAVCLCFERSEAPCSRAASPPTVFFQSFRLDVKYDIKI